MKITAFILLAFCLQVSATTLAQNITLSEHKAPLEKVINEIKRQTGYSFFYNQDWLQQARPVDVQVKNAPLEQVLKACFANQPFDYAIVNKTIVLKLKEKPIIKTETAVPIKVSGMVTDTSGTPLIGATVTIKGTNKATLTNDKGEFTIDCEIGNQIVISYVGYQNSVININGEPDFKTIRLKALSGRLNEVVVSTGYQQMPQERATGSFDFIDNKLLNRSVSPDILSRLDGVTSSVIFNKTSSAFSNQSLLTIRGRSTINSNPEPLIVVDNFEYDGDINNINPNDVESISILKDAAAASIWGVRSGNGVIVITTKKGKKNQPVKVSGNSNITLADKPNLFYANQLISSSDLVDAEKYLFNQGYYDDPLSYHYQPVPPVAEILNNVRNGTISQVDGNNQLNALKKIDNRNDIERYFFQKSINQQYNLSVSGGGTNSSFYISGGFDKDLPNLKYNSYQRATITANNSFSFLNNHLELNSGITFTKTNTRQNNPGIPSNILYPYSKLVDNSGNALEVPYQYPQSYIDTLGGGKLLNWGYSPVDEIRNANNQNELIDYQIKTNVTYRIIPGLSISALYLYSKGNSDSEQNYSTQTYFARNLINEYTNLNGTPKYPVPLGNILDESFSSYYTNNIRGQISFDKEFGGKNRISFIGGSEYKGYFSQLKSLGLYGYNPDLQTSVPVDFVNAYPTNPFGGASQIPSNNFRSTTTDHYFSYFLNGSYSYDDKYILSASGRIDQSNLFGVTTNMKSIPLWSTGASWIVSKEKFYDISILPVLKLRITEGYNANINKSLSAFTTANNLGYNTYLESISKIVNPPNPSLRWEKVNVLNLAVDFGFKNNIINGSIEYYNKNATDLVGPNQINPSSGVTLFTGNTASAVTKGIDLTINSSNIFSNNFKWTTNFLFSYVTSKVTKYYQPASQTSFYASNGGGYLTPLVGSPIYSVFAYPYGGLDKSGNPQGYLNGVLSENYGAILQSTDIKNIKLMGSATPTKFGSLRNNFSWKQFDLSLNITYELGYYFRKVAFQSGTLTIGESSGDLAPGYAQRWQNPGDENKTNVPSFIYPADPNRDLFYAVSTVNVVKGDNIRIKDMQLSYNLPVKSPSSIFTNIKIYGYINNVGILWKANHDGLDPDTYLNNPAYPYTSPRAYSLGLKFEIK